MAAAETASGNDGGAAAAPPEDLAAQMAALVVDDDDDDGGKIVKGMFRMGQRVTVQTMAGVWRAGKVTHAHKTGRYTITMEDPSKPQGEQPREKHVHPRRIKDDSSSRSSAAPASAGDAMLNNLRMLSQLEATDREETALARQEAIASARAASTKPVTAEVRVTIIEFGRTGPQKLVKLQRQGKGGGLAGLLKIAKGTRLRVHVVQILQRKHRGQRDFFNGFAQLTP